MSTPQPPGPPEPLSPVEANPPKDDTPSNWQPWLYIRLAVVGLAITYVVAFIVQNSDRIQIDFVFAGTPAFHQVSRVMHDHLLLYRIKSALRQCICHHDPAADREYR